MPTPNLLKLTFYSVANIKDIPELEQEVRAMGSKTRSWHFLLQEEANKAMTRGLRTLFGTKASISPALLASLSGFSGEFKQCVFPNDMRKGALALNTQSLGKIVLVPSQSLRNKNTFTLVHENDETHPIYGLDNDLE